MLNILISSDMLEKLRDKHSVTRREVEQCFENKCGISLVDEREDHRTDPETLWFIAPTNDQRLLKICFMFIDGNVHIKSAFEPDANELRIYERYGK